MRTFPLEALGELTGRLIWLGLIHSVWIGLIVAAGVAVMFQLGPRWSHRARHAFLVLAMAGVALGPVAVALLLQALSAQGPRIALPGWESTIVVVTGEADAGTSIPHATTDERRRGGNPDRTRLGQSLVWAVDGLRRLRGVVVAIWLPSTACLGAFLILGARRVRRLCRESDAASPDVQARAQRLARRLRLRSIPRILVHADLAEPFLCGVYRTVIVLPGRWLPIASPERLDAILAHELAHTRRLDHLANLAQRLVDVMLIFHPAVHWLSRALRREREMCTDALAVRLTRDPLALAEALQSVARLRLHFRSPMGMRLSGTSLGGQTASLLPRIQELIGMMPTRPKRRLWPFAALPAAGVIALIATAAGLARDDRPSSSAGETSGFRVSARANSAKLPESDRQTAFEVRFCWLPASPWRELLLDRLRTIKQEADVSAWIMDDKALLDLLTLAQNDTRSNVLQAPKVTTFEGDRATIFSASKRFYVADVERDGKGFRPIVKNLELGLKIDLTGTSLPRGIRLSADASHSSVLGFHTLVRKAKVDGAVVAASYQVPTPINRRCRVSCDLPEGASLVISTGLSDDRGNLSGIAGFASDALESVGLPKLEGKSTAYEQLIIVKPRLIVLEAEKPPAVAPPVPQAQGLGPISR
jgi:beta-lactamase regulating signal transducer with metallopeptidase domain